MLTRTVRKYDVWEGAEETALRDGVRKHGTGAWEIIRNDPEFSVLRDRTGVQLKDKWRNLVKYNHIAQDELYVQKTLTKPRKRKEEKEFPEKRNARRASSASPDFVFRRGAPASAGAHRPRSHPRLTRQNTMDDVPVSDEGTESGEDLYAALSMQAAASAAGYLNATAVLWWLSNMKAGSTDPVAPGSTLPNMPQLDADSLQASLAQLAPDIDASTLQSWLAALLNRQPDGTPSQEPGDSPTQHAQHPLQQLDMESLRAWCVPFVQEHLGPPPHTRNPAMKAPRQHQSSSSSLDCGGPSTHNAQQHSSGSCRPEHCSFPAAIAAKRHAACHEPSSADDNHHSSSPQHTAGSSPTDPHMSKPSTPAQEPMGNPKASPSHQPNSSACHDPSRSDDIAAPPHAEDSDASKLHPMQPADPHPYSPKLRWGGFGRRT